MKFQAFIVALFVVVVPCLAQSGDVAEFNLNRFLQDSNRRFSPDNNTNVSAKVAIYCSSALDPCEVLIWDYHQTMGTGLVKVDFQVVRVEGAKIDLSEPLVGAGEFRVRRGKLPSRLTPKNAPIPARFEFMIRVSGLGIQPKRHKLMFPLGVFPYNHEAHPMVLDLVWDGEEFKPF